MGNGWKRLRLMRLKIHEVAKARQHFQPRTGPQMPIRNTKSPRTRTLPLALLCSRIQDQANDQPIQPFIHQRGSEVERMHSPSTSPKIKINTILTNILGCCAKLLTPASPAIPSVNPAARPHSPTARPVPRFTSAVYKDSWTRMWLAMITLAIKP